MDIKEHKKQFLDKPTDNKIDIYVEQNLKINEQRSESKLWRKTVIDIVLKKGLLSSLINTPADEFQQENKITQ